MDVGTEKDTGMVSDAMDDVTCVEACWGISNTWELVDSEVQGDGDVEVLGEVRGNGEVRADN